MESIPQLTYVENFLSPSQEASLLEVVDASPWLDDLKRRVQHYGFKYDYKARRIDESMFLGPLPDWAAGVASMLDQQGLFRLLPDQLIVNEYLPGQGISAHVDCEPCFHDTIASITLGSSCDMDFTHVDTGEKRTVHLQSRSVIVLHGESRYLWKHAIAGRKSDVVDGKRVLRTRRVSLTFRNVLLGS
ncbi:alpha-ketoglutarate-dependent dioxygenase AlkB [Aporhodopirellula aestuarii]|uniref:Alpha-ketoglutarate-dependent dioxygenase AlkB n=1 Tax=Aporhodopirellula aestuarii TaxID=2950107 RepID=A0ABT0UDW6_9BACT|nr:alpha-ketoglutarate-dependent dioxygenase AlkB [Aporhodopirellula aestuarii]MCM2374573.1 alpha-ketoglutarate-dependent dioxygenase AlkB [Aporhodopirellula aestuarii]